MGSLLENFVLLLNVAPLALSLPSNPSQEQPGFVQYPINVIQDESRSILGKRQHQTDLYTPAGAGSLSVDIFLGSPPQKTTVTLDTGSYDLWVNPKCANAKHPQLCNKVPQFAKSRSKSLKDLHKSFDADYQDKSWVDFELYSDDIKVSDIVVPGQPFGIASGSGIADQGIMGVAPTGKDRKKTRPTIVDSLAKEEIIKSRAFSLDTGRVGSGMGYVTFGGLDPARFSGRLEKLPMEKQDEDKDREYIIQLDGISLNIDNENHPIDGSSASVVIDSGTSITELPIDAVEELLDHFPGFEQDTDGNLLIDCEYAKKPGSLNFQFGKTTIVNSFSEMIWKEPGSDLCALGFRVAVGDKAILGVTFLRSAYVVFDIDNSDIYLANNAPGDWYKSSPTAIGKGHNAVPTTTGTAPPPN